MHKRQEIRERVVEALKGQTDCGQNVYSSRGRSLFQMKLPEITVYTESESSEVLNPPFSALKRTLKVIVEAASTQKEHIDNELDELCSQIEAVLKTSTRPLFGGLVQSLKLTSTDMGLADKGDSIIGVAKLTFDAEYDTEL